MSKITRMITAFHGRAAELCSEDRTLRVRLQSLQASDASTDVSTSTVVNLGDIRVVKSTSSGKLSSSDGGGGGRPRERVTRHTCVTTTSKSHAVDVDVSYSARSVIYRHSDNRSIPPAQMTSTSISRQTTWNSENRFKIMQRCRGGKLTRQRSLSESTRATSETQSARNA